MTYYGTKFPYPLHNRDFSIGCQVSLNVDGTFKREVGYIEDFSISKSGPSQGKVRKVVIRLRKYGPPAYRTLDGSQLLPLNTKWKGATGDKWAYSKIGPSKYCNWECNCKDFGPRCYGCTTVNGPTTSRFLDICQGFDRLVEKLPKSDEGIKRKRVQWGLKKAKKKKRENGEKFCRGQKNNNHLSQHLKKKFRRQKGYPYSYTRRQQRELRREKRFCRFQLKAGLGQGASLRLSGNPNTSKSRKASGW